MCREAFRNRLGKDGEEGSCGGLTLAGRQVPTKAALSLPLLNWTGERKYNERLMGRGKDREITHQLLSQAKQTRLGEKLVYFITSQKQSRIMRNKTKS